MSDDEAQAAKDRLHAAIREYHDTVYPGQYVEAWVLCTHRLSAELEQANSSVVGHLVPTGQPWPMTVGILRITSQQAENSGEDDDE
ncbi:hypothetical protein [Microbacterium terrisoli]|jgi:hypothetical protein|uniref:hypothetical protein n=1 Tax=Microbacterium terrisoli TaxID=3242192 RepID=UPI002805047B|nr:hypothetical protein [Microbacterium protaetiae]